MLHHLIDLLTQFITSTINALGYTGVAVLMGIESAAIPLPSEIIMPFAGFLASEGRFSLLGLATAGGIGSMVGSILTYWLGMYGGRPLVERYGKYIFISSHDLDIADNFFKRFGVWSVFIGRILPVVRTFISVPAGIARVNFLWFCITSFIGSFLWSLLLGYFGLRLGPEWQRLHEQGRVFDYIIVGLILIGAVWWIRRHFKHRSMKN